jgi:cytochrome c oxidase cbb3-type subunit 4
VITGIVTALLIVIFCGIVGWAYSSRRHREFELMANMPLIDDSSEKQP